MSNLSAITELLDTSLSGVAAYTGEAPTGARLPYVVHRPLINSAETRAISGDATVWDEQTSLYACAESVEASYNLGIEIMQALDGVRLGGTTLATSMGYSGAPVEGHYESQVTVQLNQGGI